MNKVIAVIGLLLYVSTVFAQDAFVALKDETAFNQKLQTTTKQVSTIDCNFTQEKKLSMMAKKIVSKGHFCFKKENNIRWEYLQPYKYLIVIKNGMITIKDNSQTKHYDAQSNKMFKELNTFISGCIQGTILNNTKDFSISYFGNTSQYFVKLLPRNAKMKKMLNEIHIYFDKKDLTVSRLKMVEPGGDYTLIDFSDKKTNTPISDEKFIVK